MSGLWMNRPLRSAPAGRQPVDAEPRPRRTHRGAALSLVFASVLATGAATGTWTEESASAEQSRRAPHLPADPATNSRPAAGSHGGAPAASPPEHEGATREVSRSGDRWSSVYSPREYEGYQRGLEGQYVGVGLWARRMPDGAVVVDRVQPGSPAGRAGVRPGDRLRSVDGVPVTGRPVTEVVARLRGDLPAEEPTAAEAEHGEPPLARRAATPGADREPAQDAERPAPPGTAQRATGTTPGGDTTAPQDTAPPADVDPADPADPAAEPPQGSPEHAEGGHAGPGQGAATSDTEDAARPPRDTGDGAADRRGTAQRATRSGDHAGPEAASGPAGSRVVLGLERAGRQWTESLRRSRLVTRNVTVGRLTSGEPDATRIKVDAFTKNTGEQVREAVRAAPEGDALLLDLRGNSGGLVTEAATAASAFLDGGLVATYDVRGEQRVVNAEPGGDTQTPLVVLVDGGTMSAGELLTGALQDRGRAVVIGSRTFGKGSVQMPTERPDGSVAQETVGHYRTPVGRGVEGVGITPDLTVGDDAEQRAQSVLSGLGGGA
ncbi:S41 family peptidase [Streptomyces sp. 71268]|nr:S41 family peptidase [Streptomyces sp. 71268]WEV27526.1 S41 family peptidase [Streptomyces sp. 71268]